MKKEIVLGIFVDPIGTSQETPEEEMDYFIKKLSEEIPELDIMPKLMLHPGDLAETPVDVFVLDFGGMMPGCDDFVRSIHRNFAEQLLDKPNTLFILNSTLSRVWLEAALEEFIGHTPGQDGDIEFPNLIKWIAGEDESYNKVRAWFCIQEKE
jgi:hypothetical protein